MAERHDITITIADNGEVMVSVEGLSGPKCIKATDFVIDDLGDIISQEHTSEYYKTDVVDENIKNTNQ
jgi:hypothetical protein